MRPAPLLIACAATVLVPAVDARGASPANMRLKLVGTSGGGVPAGERAELRARITPYVAGQTVTVRLEQRGRTIQRWTAPVRRAGRAGRIRVRSRALVRPASYRFVADKPATADQGAVTKRSRRFGVRYPDLGAGSRGPSVRLFNRLLRKLGYYNTDRSVYGSHTARAVLAWRKVNSRARTTDATSEIFRSVAAGRGGYRLRYPRSGRHVETDISRQVMVLASGGRARHIFHISSGKASTPSDYGTYRFYSKQPGFNSIGMYYSVYYNRGEATHGYKSVPPYPASHGCLRNPIPDSKFIYNWIHLGDRIHVYG